MIDATSVHHIGIAVKSIEAHRSFYENVLGARYEGTEEIEDQGLRIAFFAVGSGGGTVRLELLEPVTEDSSVAPFLAKRGEGIHHVAYGVIEIQERLAELKERGVRLIDERPRAGAHNLNIAFLHPSSTGGVLTELCEER